jgi:sugar phosphate isomerase/epimerase
VGYQAIEVAPFTLAEDVNAIPPAQRKKIRKSATKAGLSIVGLHWLLVSPKGLHLTSPDPSLRDKTQRYLCDLVDFAADLGAPVMVFGSPKQRNVLEGVKPEEARSWAVDSMQRVGVHAEHRGDVTLCMEPLPAQETNFLNTLADVSQFVSDVNHPRIQMMMDVKSACSEGQPLDKLFLKHADRIKHLHANDENRRGPGFGQTDFVPLMKALGSRKFPGAVSVEVFDYTPDPETIAIQSLEALKRFLAKGREG